MASRLLVDKNSLLFKINDQDIRSNTEIQNRDRMCSQNNVSGDCCKAQQRLMNLMISKTKDVQPKILTDASIKKRMEFSEPPFICKVQNLEHINALKAERKVRNVVVIHDGRNDYHHKNHVFNHSTSIEVTIENNSKKPVEGCIKEELNKQPQTSNWKKELNTHENGFMNINQKMKTTFSFENNNSILENAGLAHSTLKRLQHGLVENEPKVSNTHTANKQATSNSRPLRISEALEMHERENEITPVYKADDISENNMSKCSFISSSKDNLLKVERKKISELRENYNRDLSINKAIENKDYKDLDNGIMESNQKRKTSVSCENTSSRITDNNSNSNNTLNRLQHGLVKNEPEVSKARTVNKQATAKSRRLTISEALEMHERENQIILSDSTSKNVSKRSNLFSSKDNLLKVENQKISELHDNFNNNVNIDKAIESNCKKPNENSIKEKHYKQLKTSDREEKSGNSKNLGNGFMESNQKIKTSFENSCSNTKDNNSNSENLELTDSTLKRLQDWFVKNEPEVFKVHSAVKQVSAKSRPLTISEALEIHERESEINPLYKVDGCRKNNLSKSSFFSSTKDNLPKVENLKITELHENFLVEKLESPMKNGRNLSLEDKIDCESKVLSDGSSYNVSPRYRSIPNNRSPIAHHDNFKNGNSSIGDQRFSIFTKNNGKGDMQKSRRYTESQSDMYKQNRDGSTENSFTKSRNGANICKKSKSLLSLDCTDENNCKHYFAEKTKNLKTSLFRSSENLCLKKNYSVDTTEERFISEEQDVELINNEGFKPRYGRNYRPEFSRFTRDKLSTSSNEMISSRSCLFSESRNDNNDKCFPDPSPPIKDYSTIKKLPNSKAMPCKSDIDYLNRNICDPSKACDSFRKNQLKKTVNDSLNDSALTSSDAIHKEPAKISYILSPKDLFKKYNASNRQQTFKYAKSHSDFSEILKSSYLSPTGKDTTQNYSCLAQQRLLCRKSSKI